MSSHRCGNCSEAIMCATKAHVRVDATHSLIHKVHNVHFHFLGNHVQYIRPSTDEEFRGTELQTHPGGYRTRNRGGRITDRRNTYTRPAHHSSLPSFSYLHIQVPTYICRTIPRLGAPIRGFFEAAGYRPGYGARGTSAVFRAMGFVRGNGPR